MRTPKLMLALVFAVLVAGPPFFAPAEAQAKSFELPRATATADVQSDGSVVVTENITYDFSGSFEGGYREIPLKNGMSVSDVSVSENGRQYAPGASEELGSSGAPDTFGTANLGDAYRIVWHYRATDEERTFTVSYRLSGLAVAYDDVVDVYWQPWGDEWEESLGSLRATMILPGDPQKGEVKVFGHPASVNGETSLGPDRVSPGLVASDVPPEQFVEMRVVFPRELLTSTGGARVEPGNGLKKIIDQEAAEAQSEARAVWFQRLQPLFGLLLVALAAGLMAFVYGIALGVAEQVLEAARPHAPPEIAEGSSFYSPGYGGYVAGPAAFSFSGLENGFSSAFTPPSSSGSGGGGSFSGGGGGGGGGGGAW